MVTNIEKLIELVSYGTDNQIDWWDELDSPEEAIKLLKTASRERPSDEELEYLLILMDIDPFEILTVSWSQCLKMLEEEIEAEEE